MSLIKKFSCGDVVDNRYHLDIRIHEGRWGDVFRATDQSNERSVAVRFFPPGEDGPADFDKFTDHARTLSGLKAPGLAVPIDQGLYEEIPYVVYRWGKGQTVDDHLAERGPLNLEQTVTVLQHVLTSLSKAHGLRLTHGLLRPVKVLIDDLDGDRPHVTIVDFQIWRLYELSNGKDAFDESNLSRRLVRYTAPEVLQNHQVVPPTDVYAVGLLAIEMLTGSPAFDENHRIALIARQLDPEALQLTYDVDAGASFREFLELLLTKDPHQRPQTAGEALEILKKKKDLFLSEPPASPPGEEAEEEVAEEIEEDVADAPPEESPTSETESAAELDPDFGIDVDEELFGKDPSELRPLSGGPSSEGADVAKDDDLLDDDELFGEGLNFGDSEPAYDGPASEKSSRSAAPAALEVGGAKDDGFAVEGNRYSPNSSLMEDASDKSYDPSIAAGIPDAQLDPDDVLSAGIPSQTPPSAAPAKPRRPSKAAPKDSGMSMGTTIGIGVASLALLLVVVFFVLGGDDSDDILVPDDDVETVEAVVTHNIRITTSPPAITVLVQGRPRAVSPVDIEVRDNEFPIRVRARTGDNEITRTIDSPVAEYHIDFSEE